MTSTLAIVYGEEFLRYDFGATHPLSQLRIKLAVALMEALGLIRPPAVTIVPPPAATEDDAKLFHSAEYVDFVAQACRSGTGWLDEAHDTPAFPGGLDASLYVVGGSLRAVDLVLGGAVDHGFNLGGGLHHAHPHQASGFCILNDVGVVISALKQRGFERIMYIDIDAHQGDGVMYGFYEDGGVLDIDFHEDGRYLFPGRGHVLELGDGPGRHCKINLPFPPESGDKSYLYAFQALVPALARSYRPEIILMQCGVDTHSEDPLTHFSLSSNVYVAVADIVHHLAHELCGGRLVMFGGGGYNPAGVARGWTRIVSTITGIATAATIPEAWRAEFTRLTGQRAPVSLTEETADDESYQEVRESVAWLKRRLGLD